MKLFGTAESAIDIFGAVVSAIKTKIHATVKIILGRKQYVI